MIIALGDSFLSNKQHLDRISSWWCVPSLVLIDRHWDQDFLE